MNYLIDVMIVRNAIYIAMVFGETLNPETVQRWQKGAK